MNDVMGSVAYDVIAEFDSTAFNDNIAKGLARGRDEMGRFVKEHRTISENMMKDMGSILGAGSSSAMSVMSRNMSKAADAAGKGMLSRLSAAAKSIPKSMGEAISSGAMATLSSAGDKLGKHISDAVADTVQKSAPFWKKSFQGAFNEAADVNTTTQLAKLADKIKGGGENAGKGFQEALSDRFSKAGIVASAKLGTFAAQVANKIIPGSKSAGDEGVEALARPFSDRLPTLVKVGAGLAAGAGVLALVSRMRKGGKDAADSMGDGLESGAGPAGESAGGAAVRGFAARVGDIKELAASAMESAGDAIESAAGKVGAGAAKAMGDALKLGANVAGGAIAGILGVSLAKGAGRLKAIDNAEASLRGLASTANHVPQIMDAVNDAMTGTAFGLDQGAKAAAQFAAAQVPIGEMERHLGALANTASAAGGDFDGVASIFSKVAAGGKVTGDVLTQLTDRGLAALPALADHLNVTAEEARKMVKEGAVSFDDFSRAMDKAMGNVAIEQATTFEGLMGNVSAAMGRFGAVAQRPFFDATKAALPGVMNLFDQLKNVIEPLAQIIADRLVPFAERLGDTLGKIKFEAPATGASELFGSLAALAPVLGGVAAMFAGPLLSSLPVIGPMLGGITGPVGVLAGALVALFAVKPETLAAGLESLTGALPGMLGGVVAKVGEVVPAMAQRFAQNAPMLVSGMTDMLGQLVGAVAQLAPMIIPPLVGSLAHLATALLGALPQLVEMGFKLVRGLANGVVDAIPVLIEAVPGMVSSLVLSITDALPGIIRSGVSIVMALVNGVIDAIPAIVDALPMIIKSLIGGITDALPLLIQGGVMLINGLVDGVVTAVPEIVTAIVGAIPMITTSIVEAVPSLLQAGMSLINGLVEGVVEGLPSIIESVVGAIPDLISALTSALPKLIDGGIQLVLGLALGIVGAIPQIVTAVTDSIPQILNGLIEAMPQLVEGGIQVVIGLIGGIIEAIPQLIVAVVGAIPQILSALVGAVGQLISGGVKLVGGLISGIWNATPAIIDAVKSIIPQLLTGLATAMPQLTLFFTNTWKNITTGITSAWNAVVKFFADTWASITRAATDAWSALTQWISDLFTASVETVEAIWSGFGDFLSGLWGNITTGAQDAWNALTSWLTSVFDGAVSGAQAIWGGITSFFTGLWDGVTTAFQTFLGFVEKKPKEAFENAVSAIGKVWDGIKELAKAPVKFVIETVINGMIGTINELPGVNIAKVPLPKGFATGGILPGMSRMSDGDDQIIAARRGEGVMVSEALRSSRDRSAFLAANSAGRRGVGFADAIQGLARGGFVDPLPKGSFTVSQPFHAGHNGIDLAAVTGTPIFSAAPGVVSYSQWSGFGGGNEVHVDHGDGLQTWYAHMVSPGARVGTNVKAGTRIGKVGSTGNSTGPHLHYMVLPGGWPNYVNPAAYMGAAGKDMGEGETGFSLLSGIASWATDKFNSAFPDAGMWVDVAGGIMKSGIDQVVSWGKGLLGFDGNGGDKGGTKGHLFDNGGIMPHGTTGINLSGKPEAVLTNTEMRGYKSIMGALGSGATGATAGIGATAAMSGKDLVKALSSAVEARVKIEAQLEFDKKVNSRIFKDIGEQFGKDFVAGLQGSTDQVATTISGMTAALKTAHTDYWKNISDTEQKVIDLREKVKNQTATKDKDGKTVMVAGPYQTKAERAFLKEELKRAEEDLKAMRKVKREGAGSLAELTKASRAQEAKLAQIATQRERTAAKLLAAQEKLDAATAQRDDWVKSVQSGITGQGSIAGISTVGGMVRNLERTIAQTQNFNKAITDLKKLGLDDEAIKQLTQEFQSTGNSKAAERLAQGGAAAVKEINALQKQLNAQAGKVATGTGDMLYKAGVDAAAGLVKGLESQEKALLAASKKIADAITSQIKKTLQIKSPSRVTEGLGSDTGEGMVNGMVRWIKPAQDAYAKLLAPEPELSIRGTGATGGGAAYSANVSAQPARQIIISEGAIVVHESGDARRTAIEVVDRLAETVELGGL